MSVSQKGFGDALLAADAPVPDGLVDPEGRPAGKRFDVYRNNVAVSLAAALETAFPVIHKLLGEQNFRTLAAVYVRKHPPRSPLMMFYGEDMPSFLADFPPVARLGYLPDVAALELALRRSYHAADAPALDPARLQSLSPEDLMALRLRIAPAARVLRSPWPVLSIWRYNTVPGAPKPAAQAEDVLIVRNGFDPVPLPLAAGGAAFVGALVRGDTLGAASEAAQADAPDFDLAATLGQLLSHAALTDLENTT